MAARRVASPVAGPFASKHRHTLIKVSRFPERYRDVENAETGHRSSKPVGRDGPLEDWKAGSVGKEDEKIILTPVPEKCVPGRKDQIEAKQQAENYEKNDGQFLNHTVKL